MTTPPPAGALFLKRLEANRLPPHGRSTPWPLPGKPTRKSQGRLFVCRTGFHLAPFTGRGISSWYDQRNRLINWLAIVSPGARVYVSESHEDKFVCTQAELVRTWDMGYDDLTRALDGLILGAEWFKAECKKAPYTDQEPRP